MLRKYSASALIMLFIFLAGCSSIEDVPEEFVEEELPYTSISFYISIGDPEKALSEYEQASVKEPESKETRLLYSRLLLLAGRLDEAQAELDKLVAVDQQNTDAFFNLSLIEGIRGNRITQKEYLQKIIGIDSEHVQANASLGEISLIEEDFPKAREYFEDVLAIDSQNTVVLMGLGNISLREEKNNEALLLFDRILIDEPDFSFAYLDRSKAKRAIGDTLGALADITEAINLDREYYWNYIDRGRLLIELRRKEEALADFNKAVEIDPDYFIAYGYRAGLNYQADKINAAINDYEKVIEKKADYHFAYGPLGGLYFIAAKWNRSAEMFQKAYEYENLEYSFILLKALALKQGGMEKEARKYLEGTMKQLPGKSWYYIIARYLAGEGSEFFTVNAANKEKDKRLKGQMLFYLGSQFLYEGKTVAGLKYLIEARDIKGEDILERRIAHWLLLEDNKIDE